MRMSDLQRVATLVSSDDRYVPEAVKLMEQADAELVQLREDLKHANEQIDSLRDALRVACEETRLLRAEVERRDAIVGLLRKGYRCFGSWEFDNREDAEALEAALAAEKNLSDSVTPA